MPVNDWSKGERWFSIKVGYAETLPSSRIVLCHIVGLTGILNAIIWVMKKIVSIIIILACLSVAYASKIKRLNFTELSTSSKFIVLGHVEKIVKSDETSDTVRIQIVEVLKGKLHIPGYFDLCLRNKGVKDFDPILKVGDKGVFFLSEIEGTEGSLAYWGSIGIFQKDNYEAKSPARALKNSSQW